MRSAKSQPAQDAVTALVFVFVVGALSMIWPGIMALSFGLFSLIQPFGSGQEFTMLLSPNVRAVPMVVTPF